jgi:uncharacterized protein YutE (UPF0331/DUF86 family)
VKDKAAILGELDALIVQGGALDSRGGVGHSFIAPHAIADAQYWLSSVVARLESFLPTTSFQLTEAARLATRSHRQGGIIRSDVDALLGHLRFLRDAFGGDLLQSLQNEISAADFADFLGHARYYMAEGKKVEAAVIAAAVFEDGVKRLGLASGVQDVSSLDGTISALRTSGVFSSVEAKQLRYLAGIRNAALHASWQEFELDAVRDLIDGCDKVLATLAELS